MFHLILSIWNEKDHFVRCFVQSLSCIWFPVTPWITAHQAACLSLSPGIHSNLRPLCRWQYLTSHLLLFPSPFSFNFSQHHGLFPMTLYMRLHKYLFDEASDRYRAFLCSPASAVHLNFICIVVEWNKVRRNTRQEGEITYNLYGIKSKPVSRFLFPEFLKAV